MDYIWLCIFFSVFGGMWLPLGQVHRQMSKIGTLNSEMRQIISILPSAGKKLFSAKYHTRQTKCLYRILNEFPGVCMSDNKCFTPECVYEWILEIKAKAIEASQSF